MDQAFDWAEQHGLKILVDLHTVSGGQNGSDNSGLSDVCFFLFTIMDRIFVGRSVGTI